MFPSKPSNRIHVVFNTLNVLISGKPWKGLSGTLMTAFPANPPLKPTLENVVNPFPPNPSLDNQIMNTMTNSAIESSAEINQSASNEGYICSNIKENDESSSDLSSPEMEGVIKKN